MNQPKCWVTLFCFLLCLMPNACNSRDIKDKTVVSNASQGGGKIVEKHYLGRFLVEVPIDMTLDVLSQKFRDCEVKEFTWKQNHDHLSELSSIWKAQIEKIETLEPPRGIKKAIIDLREVSGVGRSAKGVFYYGDNIFDSRGNWKLLVDTGASGIWMNFRGDISEKEEMLNWIIDIAKSYHPRPASNGFDEKNSFHLKDGLISLPYIEQESTYARFLRQSLELKLEIEMNDTHVDEPKNEGLLARTAAAILTRFAFGVDIHKIRSRDRKVAGLDGEEQVVRMKDKDGTELDFTWRYAGKKDSGEYPKIVVTMESPDGNLKEKLKVWDAILDSMKPLYKQ